MVLGGRTRVASGIPITATSQKWAGPFPLLLSISLPGAPDRAGHLSSLSPGKPRKHKGPMWGGRRSQGQRMGTPRGMTEIPRGKTGTSRGRTRIPRGKGRDPTGEDGDSKGKTGTLHGEDGDPWGEDKDPTGEDRDSKGGRRGPYRGRMGTPVMEDGDPHGEDGTPHGEEKSSLVKVINGLVVGLVLLVPSGV